MGRIFYFSIRSSRDGLNRIYMVLRFVSGRGIGWLGHGYIWLSKSTKEI